MLEPRGLYRIDGKRPDGFTMIPWEMVKQLVWDVTVVDALAPSRLNQGSLCNPRTTDTEARKIEKYRELIDNGYIFQPVALEVEGSLGESSEIFITRLCKLLCRSHDDQRAGSFLKQRISMALQIGQRHFVTSHLGDKMASVTWARKVSTRRADQIDQLTDIFKEVSIFVVWLGRFAPFVK